eukprot:TRINITY_DN495_c2_g1_i1.p1 TRINITY_DN495_c2_g1~~TRINITY_DN495_c2_g1_i1.p1  ORF type:complete len:114 (-),score=18.13 TRINITY_DN495_c2_g1_i1:268-609(-)
MAAGSQKYLLAHRMTKTNKKVRPKNLMGAKGISNHFQDCLKDHSVTLIKCRENSKNMKQQALVMIPLHSSNYNNKQTKKKKKREKAAFSLQNYQTKPKKEVRKGGNYGTINDR